MIEIKFPDWFENKTIAVVGNAQSQFLKKQGIEIDSHDIVIRFNWAAGIFYKEKYAEEQGVKTDIWSLWHGYDWKRYGVPFKGKILHVGNVEREKTEADYMIPHEVFVECAGLTKSFEPSSGFLVLYMLMNCNPSRVDIYGFDWKKTPTFTHNDIIIGPHKYENEEKWIRENVLVRENYHLW